MLLPTSSMPARSVDDDPVMRVGLGHRPKPVAHPGVEAVVLAFEAVELPAAHSPLEHLDGRVDEHDQIGPARVDRPLVDLTYLGDRQTTSVSLVRERRVHAAIADDVAPCGQGRCNDLFDVLGSVGGCQQRFGAMRQVGQ